MSDLDTEIRLASLSIGIGLWLTAAGALIVVIGAVHALRQARAPKAVV
jgi:hypothetical protein